jgi:hypothetical protein
MKGRQMSKDEAVNKDHEITELRQWLHRIEEACAHPKKTTISTRRVRDAAMAALFRKPAPRSFGLEGMK